MSTRKRRKNKAEEIFEVIKAKNFQNYGWLPSKRFRKLKNIKQDI